MINIELDLSDFVKMAERLDAAADQVPFALARAMNDAAIATKRRLASETWPQHVNARSPNFIKAALHINWATKYDITVTISDSIGRGNLEQHAHGGMSEPKTARSLAIPVGTWVQRTQHGVAKRMTPRSIIANTPKRALRVTSTGIFVGKGGRLEMKYALKPTVQVKADVPFEQDFRRFMLEEVQTSFVKRIGEAMKTRR